MRHVAYIIAATMLAGLVASCTTEPSYASRYGYTPGSRTYTTNTAYAEERYHPH